MSLSLGPAAQDHLSVDESLSAAQFQYQLTRTPTPNRFLRRRTLNRALDEPVNVEKESACSGENSSDANRTYHTKATDPPDVTIDQALKDQRDHPRPSVFYVTQKANSYYHQPGCSPTTNQELHKDRFQCPGPRVIFEGDSEALLSTLKALPRPVDYEDEELTLDQAIRESARHSRANQGRNMSKLQETLGRLSQQSATAGKDTRPAIDNGPPLTLLHHGDQARFLASQAFSRINKDHITHEVTNLKIPKSPPQQPFQPITRRRLPSLVVAKNTHAREENELSIQPSKRGLKRPSPRQPLVALNGQQPQISQMLLPTPSTSKRVVRAKDDESQRNPKRRRATSHLPVDELELSADKFFAIPEDPQSDPEDPGNDPVEEQTIVHVRSPSSRIATSRKQRENLLSATRISDRTATKKVGKASIETLSGFKVLPAVVEVGPKLSPKMAVSDGFELAELQPSVRTRVKTPRRKQRGGGRAPKATSLKYFAQLEIVEDGVPENHSNVADFRQNHAPRGRALPKHESKGHEYLIDVDVLPAVTITVPSGSFAAKKEPETMSVKAQPMILGGHDEATLVRQQAVHELPVSTQVYKPLAQELLVDEAEAPEDAMELDPDPNVILAQTETSPAIQHAPAEYSMENVQSVNPPVAVIEQASEPSSRTICHPDAEVVDDEPVGKMIQSAQVQHNADEMEVEMQVEAGVEEAQKQGDDLGPHKSVVKVKRQVTFSEEVEVTTMSPDYASTTESEDEVETGSDHESESGSEETSDGSEEGEDEEAESEDEEMELPEDEFVAEDGEAEEEEMKLPENRVATEAEADERETDHNSDRHSKLSSPELVSSRYSRTEVPESSQPGALEEAQNDSDDDTESEFQNDEVQPNRSDVMILDDIEDDGPQNQATQLVGRGDVHGTGDIEDDILIGSPQTPARRPADADSPISWSFMRQLVARANLNSNLDSRDCHDDEGHRSVSAAHVDLASGVFNEDLSENEDGDEVLAKTTSSLLNTSSIRPVPNSAEHGFATHISPVFFGGARVVHPPTRPAVSNEPPFQPRSSVLAKRSKTNVARDSMGCAIAGQTVSSKPSATPSNTSLVEDVEVQRPNTRREGLPTPRQPLKGKRAKTGIAVPCVPSYFTQASQQLSPSFGADMATMMRHAKTLPTGTYVSNSDDEDDCFRKMSRELTSDDRFRSSFSQRLRIDGGDRKSIDLTELARKSSLSMVTSVVRRKGRSLPFKSPFKSSQGV